MNVAIIDLGSARLKVTISVKNETGNKILQHKGETHLSSHVSEDNIIDERFIQTSFTDTLKEVAQMIEENKCEKTVVLGAHVFRTAKNAVQIAEYIKTIIGEMTILEEWAEGALFYSRMKKLLNIDKLCVVDLGGGSVQISFGNTPDDVYSIPVGTFTLEKKFQASKDFNTAEELKNMQAFVKSFFTGVKKKNADLLVMGSNCMQTFLASALDAIDLKHNNSRYSDLEVVPLSSIEFLYNEIKNKKYDSLGKYFPENPFFMYGADKALLTLIEVCDFLSIDKIFPTNESISSSLLEFLHSNPNKLADYKIKVNDIVYSESTL